jgi:hypothetical protein
MMKKMLLTTLACFGLSGAAFAADAPPAPEKCCCEKMKDKGMDCCPEKGKGGDEGHEGHEDHKMEAPKS